MRWTTLLATWFGAGRAPWAPGTAGSVAAWPAHVLLNRLSGGLHLAAIALLGALGTWAADQEADDLGEEDPQRVVIDEVVGVLIALAFVARGGLGPKVVALGLFRLLDIAKPGPVDWVQRIRPPGVGIMADDVLAGVLSGWITKSLFKPR